MNTAMPREELEKLFDTALREVTRTTAGMQLCQSAEPPGGELYTVHITFLQGFHSSLSLCADAGFLTRMAGNMLQLDHLTPQDLEDFSKEYFNILCGHISARLFRAVNVASRFNVPAFYRGRYEPEDQSRHFALNYASDRQEGAQLIHHIPRASRRHTSTA